MNVILDGNSLSAEIKELVKTKVAELKARTGLIPCLAVCLVGDDPASQIYVSKKQKTTEELGMLSIVKKFPTNISQKALELELASLNENKSVHGILLQLPLPEGLDPDPILNSLNPIKDVDGLHPFNLGMLLNGTPQLIPCTPFGVMSLLKKYNINVSGKKALIIGRSRLVGKPMAQLLLNASATVTVAHSKTSKEDLEREISQSDIIVLALGKPNFLKGDLLKEGSVIIDVGINRLDTGKLVGDADFQSCLNSGKVSYITPVPGGIGPLTVAHLLLNTVRAFELQCFGLSSIDF